MLDGMTQSDGRNTEADKMAKLPWAWFRYILSKKSLQLQYDVEWSTLGPRKLLSICRSRRVAQLAL